MRTYGWLMILFPLLAGCASTPPTPIHTTQAPMPADIGWRQPQVEVAEEPPAPPVVIRRPASAVERVFEYKEGQTVKVDVAVGVPLTLQFGPDESVIALVGGDRSYAHDDTEHPWTVKIGEPGSKYPYVHITVTKPGLTTSLAIPTTKRLYLIDLRSAAVSKTRLVRWDYAPEPVAAMAKPRVLPDPGTPQTYNAGYQIASQGVAPTRQPRQVVDDGHKVYVLFPVNLAVMEAPLARLIGPNGPELFNPRLVGSVMVVDHLFQRLELRLGATESAPVVTITRQTPIAIDCPGDDRCPRWPSADLARR